MEFLAAHDRAVNAFHSEPKVHEEPQITVFAAYTTYLGYAVLILCGHIRDMFARLLGRGRYLRRNTDFPSDNVMFFAPLLKSWENFYTRRLYHRIQDCFNRPIASSPGANIHVLERVSSDGNKTMILLDKLDNLETPQLKSKYTAGSHFVKISGDRVARACLNLENMEQRLCIGKLRLVANFLGKEDAMALNMGFNTNTTTIPALVTRGDLIISDQLNHTSIVNGARASGAAIRTFRHNDADHLESILREAITMGRPRTRRPWNKILVIVEGIYSMEGEYCDLRSVVRVSKKYGAYIYLDEAHSIGAMGRTGRGCTEYCGVDTADIDIMMGTFTKSFGGMGGYIAVISSFKVIMGLDGTDIGKQKLRALRDNSNYFRMRLNDMGLHVLGHYDSPIMPVMLYNPTKIAAFSRECLKRGLAVVVVGFPACPILMSRARFCISAGHTREELDRALVEIDEIADLLKLRYAKSTFG
ncbi:Aminotransferase class I and II [Fragilaria crotonensis]|nr:Aminotransferase class I and II [Fragilaria crotonensis]